MLTIELEQDEDGRWIAEIIALAGVVTYGATLQQAHARAAALALRVIADRIENDEPIPAEARALFAPPCPISLAFYIQIDISLQ